MTAPFRAPCLHQHSPGATNKQWYPPAGHCRPGALLPFSLPMICVDKRSLPLQRTPLCPEAFCWLKEQMWCRQQQCQLPPALTWREQLNKRRRWFSPTDFSVLQPFSRSGLKKPPITATCSNGLDDGESCQLGSGLTQPVHFT